MNISVTMKCSIDGDGQTIYEAVAFTKGYAAKGTGYTQVGAIRSLIANLKVMNRFSRVARSVLETKIGFHQCNLHFKLESKKPKDDN